MNWPSRSRRLFRGVRGRGSAALLAAAVAVLLVRPPAPPSFPAGSPSPDARLGSAAALDTVGGPWFCGGGEAGGGAAAEERPGPGAAAPADDPPANRDLYCQRLLPAPGVEGPRGDVQLAPAASPFGVPLTAEGRFRYRVSLRVRGFPDPVEMGDYRAYVAWAADPRLRPVVRLGRVGNGTRRLGTVDLNKFLVLVTAERRADAEEPRGKVVLRTQSPSMRLQPHDLPFGFMRGRPPGARRQEPGPDTAAPVPAGGEAAAALDTAVGQPASPSDTAAARGGSWTPPPMHPRVQMVPLLRSVLPSVRPFLPGPGEGVPPAAAAGGPEGAAAPEAAASLPEARPREVERLEDGDTLHLAARKVRRRVGGRTFVMYGFNAQYPGPLIRVPRGAEIVVRFRNRIDLPTTIHWHGLRIQNRFDGVPELTQEPVPPGGSFTYRVRFPDAGVYWYHPHVREDVQQDLGLYGNMLVEPGGREGGALPGAAGARRATERPADGGSSRGGARADTSPARPRLPRPEPEGLRADPAADHHTYGGHFGPAHREEVVMLDDLLLAGDSLVPYGRDASTHALMGRFGNAFLVNGEPRYRLTVRRGEVVRFYLTNVASTRTFNLSFGDLPVKVVASDLSRFEREVRSPNVVLGPAERYVVEVRFDEPGTVPLLNRVQALDHVYGNFFTETDTLGVIRVRPREPDHRHAAAFDTLRTHPELVEEIERYRAAFDRRVDRELHLAMEARGLPFPIGPLMRKDSVYFHPVEMSGTMPRMNWASTTREVRWILRDPATGRQNMEIDWSFRVGELVKVRLRNLRHSPHAMQHPIHVHGQRFLVLSRSGRRNDNLVWKDTAIVPVGTTATLLLELTNPGEWMIHCHISEHLDAGMRMTFTVEKPEHGSSP